jgi:hypothetical protein
VSPLRGDGDFIVGPVFLVDLLLGYLDELTDILKIPKFFILTHSC